MMKKAFYRSGAAGSGKCVAERAAKPPSPDELKALQEIVNTKTVEARVAAVDKFVQGFPKSDYRNFALTMAADAYETTGNTTKAIIYYQQALEANPKDYNAMLMLAAETARTTREFDLDKEEKLAKAEKYAKDGMALIPDAPKPNAQVTEQQWTDLKKDDTARGHEALGLVALARKKYDVAAGEFKTATEMRPSPSQRRSSAWEAPTRTRANLTRRSPRWTKCWPCRIFPISSSRWRSPKKRAPKKPKPVRSSSRGIHSRTRCRAYLARSGFCGLLL